MKAFAEVLNTTNVAAAAITFGIFLTIVIVYVRSRRADQLKQDITAQWKNLLGLCRDPLNWPQIIIVADNLLASSLKARKIRGKTTGEMLVKAQRILSDNDAIWSAHKLRGKLEQNPKMSLEKDEFKEVLLSFYQALKDLEAL